MRLIAAAATAGVPAATLLDAWAEDSRGGQGTRLEKAVRRLRQGAKASEAVAAVPGLVQEDHLVPLAYGERLGLVGPMIRAALAADDLLDPRAGRSLRAVIGYLTFVLILLLITGFLAAFIRPQLMRLLEEMGSMRPPVFESWQQVPRRPALLAARTTGSRGPWPRRRDDPDARLPGGGCRHRLGDAAVRNRLASPAAAGAAAATGGAAARGGG